MNELFCFGFGYSALALARHLPGRDWVIKGTSTSPDGANVLARQGFEAMVFDGAAPSPDVSAAIGRATHVLVSVPPGADGDPVLAQHSACLAASPALKWVGYLSTIGVYGDHMGAWVDETSPAHPSNARSQRRLVAENAWSAFGQRTGKSVQIFRLAGIYGPGRSAIDNLRDGTARRIIKPGQVFNRIHVEDIAAVVLAAMQGRGQHQIYNVTDDEPAPPQDVITFCAQLLGVEPPPELPYASAGLSAMAASFYAENKRVRNERIKRDLGVALAYPTYREGLRALAAQQS